MKKPWLAGILNIIPGLGYLYVDQNRPFGWVLLLASVCYISGALFSSPNNSATVTLTIWDWVAFLSFILFETAFVVDAQARARHYNDAKE